MLLPKVEHRLPPRIVVQDLPALPLDGVSRQQVQLSSTRPNPFGNLRVRPCLTFVQAVVRTSSYPPFLCRHIRGIAGSHSPIPRVALLTLLRDVPGVILHESDDIEARGDALMFVGLSEPHASGLFRLSQAFPCTVWYTCLVHLFDVG